MGLISVKRVSEKKQILEPSGFNLYFAGSLNKVFEEDLKDKGAHRLASQLLDKAVIDGWMSGRDAGRCKGNLLIDSGAFSAHTRDAEVDVDAYIVE